MTEYRVVKQVNGLGKVRYQLQSRFSPYHRWLDLGPKRRWESWANADMDWYVKQCAKKNWKVVE